MNYFVTAIGTDSGKTLVSTILCHALGADYWKPIQSGSPTDSDVVKKWLGKSGVSIHPEAYLLATPASPHAAAQNEGITINTTDISLPETRVDLVIEGAGGLLVPLNSKDLMIDLIKQFEAHAILVCDLYLGSINHSLLSIEALRQRNIPLRGIVFNGTPNPQSEEIILNYAQVPCLLRILKEQKIDEDTIQHYSQQLILNWDN